MTERQGVIPLPPGEVHVHYNPKLSSEAAQQPQAQQVAVFDAQRNDECPNGSVLDINPHFVVYAVKNGLIRILHRTSTIKHLLRAHEGRRVTDIKFFLRGDVVGTVGGSAVIWRIFERGQEIVAEKLLEIPDSLLSITRLIWHPFNPNQFWLIHRDRDNKNIATLVETTRISTVAHTREGHAVCSLFSTDVVMEGAIQIISESDLTDLDWSSRDPGHILTSHVDGSIKLWDLKASSTKSARGCVPVVCKFTIQESSPVSRCFFLPHYNLARNHGNSMAETITTVFCTASHGNSVISIWSPFTESSLPSKFQIFQIEGNECDYNISMAYGQSFLQSPREPGAFFLLMSDRRGGNMYALSVKSMWVENESRHPLLEGFDYVVPFSTKYATYSWSVVVSPSVDIDETAADTGLDFDIRFYALQSKMVQDMSIPHYMLLPPTSLWEADTPGLRVELLTAGSNGICLEENMYDEDYELDENDEVEDDDYTAPHPSSLPTPDGISYAVGNDNPFANWLGNLATNPTMSEVQIPVKSTSSKVPALPLQAQEPSNQYSVPPGLFSEATDNSMLLSLESPNLLSPSEIFSSNKTEEPLVKHQKDATSKKMESQRNLSPPKAKLNQKKKVNSYPIPIPMADGKITVLKKDTENQGATAVQSDISRVVDLEDVVKKALVTHFRAQEKVMIAEIQRTVKQEVKQNMLPELNKVICNTVEQSTVRPLLSSIETLLQKAPDVNSSQIADAVLKGVETPLNEAFTESMKTMFIPAFEAATQQMFSQITDSLEKKLLAYQNNETNAKIDALTSMVQALSVEVANLKEESVSSKSEPNPPKQTSVDQIQLVRSEILALLHSRKYELAFTKAVSATTADMAVFVCKNAHLSEVLGGSSSALSQPILLCLMQQLGAVLVSSNESDLQTELLWLQEIALTLDTSDEKIQRHVPSVLQQLVTSIETKMNQRVPTLRRPLQMLLQVIRGMQR